MGAQDFTEVEPFDEDKGSEEDGCGEGHEDRSDGYQFARAGWGGTTSSARKHGDAENEEYTAESQSDTSKFPLKGIVTMEEDPLKGFPADGGGAGAVEDDGVVVPDAADLGSGADVPERGIAMVVEGVPAFVGALGEETDEAFKEHVAIVCEGEAGKY